MPVIVKTRYLLRGKIRVQCKYAVLLLNRLVKAYVTSGEVLPIATGLATGPASVANYEAIIAQLTTGLTQKG
jgi:hypothetical protein